MTSLPKISIVTVCYNCHAVIERTIRNVLRQTYPNVEYIVIDGGSTDGTREIVERYADQFAYWVSEPDGGIYEAMNKGISKATGEWILFRNAGDYFFKSTTIEDVFRWYEDKGETLIIGGMRCFGQSGFYDKFYQPKDANVWCRAYISHPSTFIRLSAQKANPYPTSFRIASDYYFFQSLMLKGCAIACYENIVSLFDCECGISTTQLARSWKEILQIRQQLDAPQHILKATRHKYWRINIWQAFISILRKNKWLYRIYENNRHQPEGWTLQPIKLTLKDA